VEGTCHGIPSGSVDISMAINAAVNNNYILLYPGAFSTSHITMEEFIN